MEPTQGTVLERLGLHPDGFAGLAFLYCGLLLAISGLLGFVVGASGQFTLSGIGSLLLGTNGLIFGLTGYRQLQRTGNDAESGETAYGAYEYGLLGFAVVLTLLFAGTILTLF